MEGRFTVYVDGSCPVCSREVRWLRRHDASSELNLTDISAPEFDAERDAHTTQLALMRRIHGRTPDGRTVVGVEVFRQIYARLGFEGVVRFSRLPIISSLLSAAYAVFAWARFRWARACRVNVRSLPVRTEVSNEKVQVS